ncbi:eukaryotic peptide chain release factor subunit 1-3-like [Heracleum sosnowskyi]|uniref:Eukaryotic peptide chain release factor subunit 1-3-like n=1 Tax=Heracleum sosnowskyi TaxID=360622 RepID=A0AAD8M9Z4_9APIA|nr:eukaryotic peptide chain release factor subunit 1-3-like [Heracleum sosnowskyi]KAK1365001.1 eukaryotic peptide chain release factor subunit 1-3-like [Heracleum sosnowskyi]KAK1365006.1 eukaryotic peptide chain release factor subunit 1-3-like [Heracleum sosnowskyi]KAK1365010.1 eukaryotic peptide chain release factor subunit 1-3-like [Heracleum sosnowskyi]KAK1365012.1 eukaryotic peptide chain release factor subunit 1-3-like [Heracleum sosnowskyi]
MSETDKTIELWKMKKRIKALEAARGSGTSMLSLLVPPRAHLSDVTKMLMHEHGTAKNIKSRVNRQSVLSAITSAQQRLKLYNKVPPNGLVLYVGTIVGDNGKEEKVTIDFEPFKPINTSVYLCDNKFHTEVLHELVESDDKFGFIVMDGNGTLFGTLSGNSREILHKFNVNLPNKQGKGGQSAQRFGRIRVEKRHNYVTKSAELATQFFINPVTSQPNVAGLILAGSADLKAELNQQDSGKYVCGVDDTLKALEMGIIDIIIVWEDIDINRYVLINSTTSEVVIKYMNKDQEVDESNFREKNGELEIEEKMPLLEWFANEYKRFGCMLQFVTNKTEEGSRFCKGFGGIGGILRYQLDMRSFDDDDGDNDGGGF